MYKGFLDVTPATDEEHAHLYEVPADNIYGCDTNQYLVIHDSSGAVTDKLKWSGIEYKSLNYRKITDDYSGCVRPLNIQQELAFDMLQDPQTTVKALLGRFGTGKSFLMASHAIHFVKTERFDQIVFVRNNIEVKDSRPLGFLPGSSNEKMLPFAMPLADHCGGTEGLNYLCRSGQLEIVPLGFLRGRDIKHSIIYVTEAENLTKEHLQLLLGRVGVGSQLWLDGDLRQVDMAVFERNNGLSLAVERLKGHRLFSCVHLEKIERSETAALADLLD